MTTTSAPAASASSAVAAPMPVAPPTTSTRLPSYRNASNRVMSPSPSGDGQRSCDDAADFQVNDGVPVKAELSEDLVAMLVELRCSLGCGGHLVVLHGR